MSGPEWVSAVTVSDEAAADARCQGTTAQWTYYSQPGPHGLSNNTWHSSAKTPARARQPRQSAPSPSALLNRPESEMTGPLPASWK